MTMTCDPQKQIAELRSIIFNMEEEIHAIIDYANLLQNASHSDFAGDGGPGSSRVCQSIKEHAAALKEARNRGQHLIGRLANP